MAIDLATLEVGEWFVAYDNPQQVMTLSSHQVGDIFTTKDRQGRVQYWAVCFIHQDSCYKLPSLIEEW